MTTSFLILLLPVIGMVLVAEPITAFSGANVAGTTSTSPHQTLGFRDVSIKAQRDSLGGLQQQLQHDSPFESSTRQIIFTPNSSVTSSRRKCLAQGGAAFMMAFLPSLAAHAKASPDEAFDDILAGREELIAAAKKYLPERDFEGLKEYLDDKDRKINSYEGNAQILLESKRLDAESKKAIGTIRRYGVGADVIIMYGGLKAELDQESPNGGQVQQYLVKCLDALSEVIVICRDNGLGKKKKQAAA